MKRRDICFLGAFAFLTTAIFGPLVFRPSMIPANFGDLYSYHYPLRHLVASTLQEGRLPLWNPYIFAGTPLAANPQAILFYPVSVLHYFLPLAWAFSLDVFFHALLAGLGAFLLLREWRVDSGGAWLLGSAYALSPFVLSRVAQGIPTHLSALAWGPWVWLAAQSDNPAWLGLTLALQVLSGHPQFSMINALGLAIFTALRRPSKLLFLAQAGSLALFLDAAQLFPTLEFLRHSVRSVWNPGMASGYSWRLAYLKTFLFPDAFGHPTLAGGAAGGFSLYPSEYFEMLTDYLGVIPLALGLYGLLRAPALWALAGAGIFFAWGRNNPLYSVLQTRLGLEFQRTPARFSLLLLWAVWLAAAIGWRRLRPRLPALAAAALAALAAADVAFWGGRWISAQDPRAFLGANPAAVAALRAGDGRFATDPDNPNPNKAELYRLYNATGYEAFYPAGIAFYTARSERLPAADGSRTYIRNWHTPEMAKLGVRYYVTTRAPALQRTPRGRVGRSPSGLDRAVDGYKPVFERAGAYIYENPEARPLVQGASAWRILSPEHWRLRLEAKSSVLLSQAMYPGWKAWANGHRLRLGLDDGLFPFLPEPINAKFLPWTIDFVFLPESWLAGAWLSLFAWLTAAFLAFRRWTAPPPLAHFPNRGGGGRPPGSTPPLPA